MKYTLILFLALTFLFTNVHSAHVVANARTGVVAALQWKVFYPRFHDAVKRRDHAALRQMMKPEFLYSFGGNLDRNEALKYWDEYEPEAWEAFAKILGQGTTSYDSTDAEGIAVPSRVAPPAAKRRGYMAWRAYFEFGKDGRWRCTGFVQGD